MNVSKLLFLVGITLLLLVSACSNGNSEKVDNEKNEPNTTNPTKEGTAEVQENFNEMGMPIVNEPITLHFMTGKPPLTAEDYNEVLIWKKYAEMTNINIDWGLTPREGLEEKRNLSLASGEYPEVFYSSGLLDTDLYKYGRQGVFIQLNDLIDEYMPNLKALFEQYPEIKKGMTFPDGSIYSLPTIYSPDFISVTSHTKPYIKKDWLEQLGMEVPQTTEEFYQYLKKVKETDLNGNGKHDEIPFGSTNIATLEFYLKGSFDVGNRGSRHSFLDVDPERGDLRFFRTSESYKELLRFMNKLFSEGLIEEKIFSIDENQFQATGSEGFYGSTVTTNPETRWGVKDEYVGMPALIGPKGDQKWVYVTSSLANKGGFAITDKNNNPEATVRWMDYFYGDEGTKLYFMGIEGETYQVTADGEIEYMDHITDPPEGITMQQAQRPYLTYLGGGYPGIVKQEFFKGAESLPSSIEATKEFEKYIIEDVWPDFTYTSDEYDKLIPLQTDIHKYADEMRDKFISGDASFSEWDKYVETIERMGLDKYMEIQKQAYERYKNS